MLFWFFYLSFLSVSQMDPVQKAVINHTFGVPQPLKKKQIISCNICHLRFNSTVRNAFVAEVVRQEGKECGCKCVCLYVDIQNKKL